MCQEGRHWALKEGETMVEGQHHTHIHTCMYAYKDSHVYIYIYICMECGRALGHCKRTKLQIMGVEEYHSEGIEKIKPQKERSQT